jgi:hypothetical protein
VEELGWILNQTSELLVLGSGNRILVNSIKYTSTKCKMRLLDKICKQKSGHLIGINNHHVTTLKIRERITDNSEWGQGKG